MTVQDELGGIGGGAWLFGGGVPCDWSAGDVAI